ncbi:hypothetical protein LCGC14_0789330, partial [marine sediment metagenome]
MKIHKEIQLDPYPNNNTHILKFTFENDVKIQFFLQSCYISIPDLNVYNYHREINRTLRKSNWFYNPKVNISIPLNLTRKIVFPYNFEMNIVVRRLEKGKYGSPNSLLLESYFQFVPAPRYRAFISRSVRENEKYAPDIISKYIQYWGFSPHTVGIPPLNKQYSDKELLYEIDKQIQMADIVFGIATRRDQLVNNLHWKTFEWLQGETGIAFSKKKQILIFVEKGIDFSGIGSKCDMLEFDLSNLKKIPLFLDKIMPILRDNIEKRLNTEALLNSLLVGGMLV